MELENLKYIWRQVGDSPMQEPSDQQILILMGRKPRDPIAKMRRNLLVELIVVVLTYVPTIAWYLIGFDGKLSGIAWVLFAMMAFFAGYAYRKDRLLKDMLCVSCQVRSNLERQVRLLKKYTRFYLAIGSLLVPVMAVFSFVLIFWNLPASPARTASWTTLTTGAILLAGFAIGFYRFNVWYINKLYGRHIRKLQEMLREMDEV